MTLAVGWMWIEWVPQVPALDASVVTLRGGGTSVTWDPVARLQVLWALSLEGMQLVLMGTCVSLPVGTVTQE